MKTGEVSFYNAPKKKAYGNVIMEWTEAFIQDSGYSLERSWWRHWTGSWPHPRLPAATNISKRSNLTGCCRLPLQKCNGAFARLKNLKYSNFQMEMKKAGIAQFDWRFFPMGAQHRSKLAVNPEMVKPELGTDTHKQLIPTALLSLCLCSEPP